MSMVAREIALDQAMGIYEFALLSHLNTKLNKLADPLSRLHDPIPSEFPMELRGAGRVPIEVPPTLWRLQDSGAKGGTA